MHMNIIKIYYVTSTALNINNIANHVWNMEYEGNLSSIIKYFVPEFETINKVPNTLRLPISTEYQLQMWPLYIMIVLTLILQL